MDELLRAAEDYLAARDRLEAAICAAHDAGTSNRKIATGTGPLGWSYEQVRKIVRKRCP